MPTAQIIPCASKLKWIKHSNFGGCHDKSKNDYLLRHQLELITATVDAPSAWSNEQEQTSWALEPFVEQRGR